MIYIACPGNVETGGTELLHQLSNILSYKFNLDNRIYYHTYNSKVDPVGDRFKKYNAKYVFEVTDVEEDFLIVPEISTELLNNYSKISKCVWWLSVDNYFKAFPKNKIKNFLKFILGRAKKKFDFKNKDITHFVQSHYAGKFLESNGINNYYFLSDYLNKDFLKEEVVYKSVNRENIVLYNPKKGFEFTKEIISYSVINGKSFQFVPLQNLTPAEIIDLGKKAKVYIDFGQHPGKDRFPREAAILGCAVITGLKGSAKYFEDIKIDSKYKFRDTDDKIQEIVELIETCMKDYDKIIGDFFEYREYIKSEYKIFVNEVSKITDVFSRSI